ncbi:hypothetical protein GCM10022284_50110 [Streptomyces hundungensis]
MPPQRTLPKRTPAQSQIHSEHVSQERAQRAYTTLYSLLLSAGVNLSHMSLKAGDLEKPVISLGPCDIPAVERLIKYLEQVDQPVVAATTSEEAESSKEAP